VRFWHTKQRICIAAIRGLRSRAVKRTTDPFFAPQAVALPIRAKRGREWGPRSAAERHKEILLTLIFIDTLGEQMVDYGILL